MKTKTTKDQRPARPTRAEQTQKNHEEALATFAANCETIRQLADALVESAEDHFCLVPEKVNWAHVGDTNRIISDLRDILAYARPEKQTPSNVKTYRHYSADGRMVKVTIPQD